MALVRKWKPLINRYRDWLAGLEGAAGDSNWFDLDSLIRMGSIALQLQQLIGEFEQVGDPKATGTTSAGSATGGEGGQRLHAMAVQNLVDRAGPLAHSTPWELVWELHPEVSESIRQGETGVAVIQALSSPFTSLTAVGFGEKMLEMRQEVVEEQQVAFDQLEESWAKTAEALERISSALDGLDLNELEGLERQLEDTLSDYERTYDGARGADDLSARALRRRAAGP